MRFKKPPRFSSQLNAQKYATEIFQWATNVFTGLTRLNFQENFTSFIVENITIPAGGTIDIVNELQELFPNETPRHRIILRQTGNGLITDGIWDNQILQLINNGAVDVTATVVFFR